VMGKPLPTGVLNSTYPAVFNGAFWLVLDRYSRWGIILVGDLATRGDQKQGELRLLPCV
jgi:hypothetical protein